MRQIWREIQFCVFCIHDLRNIYIHVSVNDLPCGTRLYSRYRVYINFMQLRNNKNTPNFMSAWDIHCTWSGFSIYVIWAIVLFYRYSCNTPSWWSLKRPISFR